MRQTLIMLLAVLGMACDQIDDIFSSKKDDPSFEGKIFFPKKSWFEHEGKRYQEWNWDYQSRADLDLFTIENDSLYTIKIWNPEFKGDITYQDSLDMEYDGYWRSRYFPLQDGFSIASDYDPDYSSDTTWVSFDLESGILSMKLYYHGYINHLSGRRWGHRRSESILLPQFQYLHDSLFTLRGPTELDIPPKDPSFARNKVWVSRDDLGRNKNIIQMKYLDNTSIYTGYAWNRKGVTDPKQRDSTLVSMDWKKERIVYKDDYFLLQDMPSDYKRHSSDTIRIEVRESELILKQFRFGSHPHQKKYEYFLVGAYQNEW